ncbi:type II CAAX prenyl endopeptidase Rce1 family protein [Ktedonospora formicarum]|uniref:Abortive infection protein n=1 Tax=Ktedonospora formicarum TaxID=2778364 RepID=A0A8J3I643_9CHLR|nr:CPBP family glutamic-type intramembrane protease [Ktedonospora formicarum]GHO46069.1 abortive infection protein [Ktedonospora formicarum]
MFGFSWFEFALLCGAALLGIACVMPYTLELTRDTFKKAQERMRQPMWVLVLLQSAQSFVLLAAATGLGLLIAHHLGLGAPLLEGLLAGNAVTTQAEAIILPALILGAIPAVVLLLLEIMVFWPRLPEVMHTSVPIPALWKRFLACFYGGIVEELLCRLFLLSLLSWLIGFVWHLPNGKPALEALWLANILAAVIFGLGHLPTTAALVKLTPLLIVRAILLNGIVGVAFGYLFWQYGLEAAMLAHFTADVVLHIIGDSIAKVIRAAEARARGEVGVPQK